MSSLLQEKKRRIKDDCKQLKCVGSFGNEFESWDTMGEKRREKQCRRRWMNPSRSLSLSLSLFLSLVPYSFFHSTCIYPRFCYAPTFISRCFASTAFGLPREEKEEEGQDEGKEEGEEKERERIWSRPELCSRADDRANIVARNPSNETLSKESLENPPLTFCDILYRLYLMNSNNT